MSNKQLTHILPFVREILLEKPETRDSDRKLMLEAWDRGGLHLTDKQRQLFMKLPSAESLTRARRKLQENGALRGKPEVTQARIEQAKAFKTTKDDLFIRGQGKIPSYDGEV